MVRDFVPSDLEGLDLLSCYEGEPDLLKNVLEVYGAPGAVLRTSLSVRGDILGVFGGTAYLRTMAIFALVTSAVKKYPKTFHVDAAVELDRWQDDMSVVRIQSIVDAQNQASIKQHESWGFVIEGYMSKSGWDMRDQVLMARVR